MVCLESTIALSQIPYKYLTEDETEDSCALRMLKTMAAVIAIVPATILYVGALIAQTLLSCCGFQRPAAIEGDSMGNLQGPVESSFTEVHEKFRTYEEILKDAYIAWKREVQSIYRHVREIASLSGDREFARATDRTLQELDLA